MRIDIHYSYACRDSYLVFAWLRRVQQSGMLLDLNWHPFAIQMEDAAEYWQQPWETANSELRGFIAAEAARQQGPEAFLRFHAALERAVHEQLLELGDEATLIGAAQQAGLAVDRFQWAWHDPALARIAQHSHKQAVECRAVFGTPTLVFANGHAFQLELTEIPPETGALATFRAIESLAVEHPYMSQLKRVNLADASTDC